MARILRAAAAALAVCAFAAPAVAREALPSAYAESFTLDNGLKVVVLPDRRAPVVTHMLWYRVGAADEVPGKSGIAHFFEHLMFKGTDEIPPGEFSKTIARNGGQDNAFTSWDFTAYFQRVAADRLDLVMRMEADRMTDLRLTDEIVAPEREVVREERRQTTEADPSRILGEQMAAALYLHHPYGRPIIGWDSEIADLTTQDALDWYARHYGPDNAVLIVAGDVDAAAVRRLVETHYGPIAARDIPARARVAEPEPRAARRLTYTDARVREPAMHRDYLAPNRASGAADGTVYALEVLAQVLGGGASSRLYRALVEDQGIAAWVYASYFAERLDVAEFSVGGAPRGDADIAAVEAAIDAEIARIVADGITEEELVRARTNLISSAVYARDSQMHMAYIYGMGLTTGSAIAEIEAWPDRIRAVTADQVREAAAAVLKPERSVTGILLPKEPAT